MTLPSRILPCLAAAFVVIAADSPPGNVPGPGNAPGNETVAQRGDVRVTGTDMRDMLNALDPASRAQVSANPQTLANFVRERVLNLSVLAEVRAKGWDQRPEVAHRANEARDAVLTQTYLASLVPFDPAYPTDAEVATAYENNKGRLVLPRQFHLAQIVFLVKPSASALEDEGIHRKAQDLRALAVRPKADFADLARKSSQERPSWDKGGDVGWLREPDMIPAARDAVASLPEGGVTPPVRMPDGWHILKLLEMKPSGALPLAEAKPQIVQALRQARAQRMMRGYLDEMLKAQPIQLNEIELTRQVAPAN